MKPEDKLKLDILADSLGLSKAEVQARGIRLLYDLLQAGHLRRKKQVPIRVGKRIVMMELEE